MKLEVSDKHFPNLSFQTCSLEYDSLNQNHPPRRSQAQVLATQ